MTDLAGRTFIVTGANTGIGLVTARTLASRKARVILACRSAEKTQPVVAELRAATGNPDVEFVALDLGSMVSIRRCAADLVARDLPIHGLINNAGLGGARGVTQDGFELTVGTNHLGPYLLTRLLLDRIGATAAADGAARIVNVASKVHYRAKAIDWAAFQGPTRSRTGFPEYGVSKLCNVLFNAHLATRLPPGVTTYALHPGVVASDVWRSVPGPLRWMIKRFMITVEEGALTTLHCATSPAVAGESGLYYDTCKAVTPSALARDAGLARELWDRSAALVGLET